MHFFFTLSFCKIGLKTEIGVRNAVSVFSKDRHFMCTVFALGGKRRLRPGFLPKNIFFVIATFFN